MYLDETPGIAFTPFNEVLLAGGPLLTAIGGGDPEGGTGFTGLSDFSNGEGSVALIRKASIVNYGNLNLVLISGWHRGRNCPDVITDILFCLGKTSLALVDFAGFKQLNLDLAFTVTLLPLDGAS